MTTDDLMPDGYTPFRILIEKDKALFKTILDKLVGVNYDPIAVSTQVVAGTNYKFFCNAKIVSPQSEYYTAMVIIFQDLKGEAHLSEIKKISY